MGFLLPPDGVFSNYVLNLLFNDIRYTTVISLCDIINLYIMEYKVPLYGNAAFQMQAIDIFSSEQLVSHCFHDEVHQSSKHCPLVRLSLPYYMD